MSAATLIPLCYVATTVVRSTFCLSFLLAADHKFVRGVHRCRQNYNSLLATARCALSLAHRSLNKEPGSEQTDSLLGFLKHHAV